MDSPFFNPFFCLLTCVILLSFSVLRKARIPCRKCPSTSPPRFSTHNLPLTPPALLVSPPWRSSKLFLSFPHSPQLTFPLSDLSRHFRLGDQSPFLIIVVGSSLFSCRHTLIRSFLVPPIFVSRIPTVIFLLRLRSLRYFCFKGSSCALHRSSHYLFSLVRAYFSGKRLLGPMLFFATFPPTASSLSDTGPYFLGFVLLFSNGSVRIISRRKPLPLFHSRDLFFNAQPSLTIALVVTARAP